MQDEWYVCLHGSSLTFSSSLNSNKQTEHLKFIHINTYPQAYYLFLKLFLVNV